MVELGNHVETTGLLEAVDKITYTVLACGLFGDGKIDMTLRGDASLVLLNLFFLSPPCLHWDVSRSQQSV